MNPTLVFDIETIPDISGLRTLHELDARVSDAEVAEMAFQLRRQKTGSDFLPHHLQRVVAISCALREGDSFRVWSLGDMHEEEAASSSAFSTVSKNTRRSWCHGTAVASICRRCIIAA